MLNHTTDAESPVLVSSSPVLVEPVSPMFSRAHVEPTVSLSNDQILEPTDSYSTLAPPETKPVHPEFAFADGNVEVQTADQLFWVHEYQLNKFSAMASLIQEARSSGTVSIADQRVKIVCNGKSEDFYNTFQVVYAPVIFGVPEFGADALVSALRISSTYDYPDLRKFAISELEKHSLPAIQLIQLSDEFFLPAWEKPAFASLCSRSEPISPQEAQILGIERFVEIARIREGEQRRHFIEIYDKSVQPHYLLTEVEAGKKPNSLRRDAELSSRNPALPHCDCRVHKSESGTRSVVPCQIHTIAPLILSECHALFKQRNEFLDQLAKVKKAVSTKQQNTPANLKITSVDSELNKAPWVRRVGSTVS